MFLSCSEPELDCIHSALIFKYKQFVPFKQKKNNPIQPFLNNQKLSFYSYLGLRKVCWRTAKINNEKFNINKKIKNIFLFYELRIINFFEC